MRERWKWPVTALLLAALGVLLQRWHRATSFEPELGLHIPAAPASWAVIAFFALAAALFVLLVHSLSVRKPGEVKLSYWDLAFAAKGDYLYLTLAVLAGLLTLTAAVFLFREAAQIMTIRKSTGEGESPVLQIVLAVCAIPGAVGMVLPAGNAFRMAGRGRENVLLLLPPLFSCVWLLEAYRSNAADPVLWDYVPLVLSVALGLVFHLSCAGLAFSSEGRPGRMLWLAGMTVASTGVALGSRPGIPMLLLLGGQLLHAMAALWVAPANLRRPPKAKGFGLRARWEAGLPLDGGAMEEENRDDFDREGGEPDREEDLEDTTDGQ